jgi:inositol phosphorylceramide mannosyltransferase catalytic subunit
MTASDWSRLPEDIRANLDGIRAMNPGWDLRIYNDADIPAFLEKTYGPSVLAIQSLIDARYGAARADCFRYLCLYAEGGVYLDLKSATLVPLDEWLRVDDRFIVSQWDNGPGARYEDWGLQRELRHVPGGEYQQWFIASSAGHPFLKAVVETVLGNIAGYGPVPALYGRYGVVRITGPIAYTLAIQPIVEQHPHRAVNVEQQRYVRYSIYDGERGHYVAFKGHYSQLRDPIVPLAGVNQRVFEIARGCRETSMLLKARTRVVLSRIKKALLRR